MNIKRMARTAVKGTCILFYRIMNRLLSLSDKRVVISSSLGKSYSGNPKAIYEEMVRSGIDGKYECIWFYEKKKFDIPGRHIQVKDGRFRYLYYMATAKFWIFDARQPKFLRKRNKVAYIQTWHGTPLKKLALDMDTVYMAGEESIDAYKEEFRKNALTWDYLISQNPFSTEVFRRAFDYSGLMLEVGYPRNDVLFRYNNETDIRRIKKELSLPPDKKIMLYAPTWRDDESFGLGRYHYSNALCMDDMYNAFGNDYILILKYHYLVEDNTDWSKYNGFVKVYNQSVDIASLYLVSDMLITDYSSVMFDYSLLDRPMYFYCYDLQKYKNVLRGFYFDFENSAPGPVSVTTLSLVDDIINERHKDFAEKYGEFKRCYNPWDDGLSSSKVIDVLFSHNGGSEGV